MDEILKASKEQELVLEDDSPDKREEDPEDFGASLVTKTDENERRARRGAFRVVIKSEKEQKIKALTNAQLIQ